MLRPLRGAGESRVAQELGLADHRAEPLEEVLRRRREHDPLSVLRREGTARPARVLETAALADDLLPAVERGRVLHHAKRRLVERGVDPLPLTGRIAMAERGQHAERGEQTGHVVGVHRRRARRWAIVRTVDVPRAAEGRSDRRVAGPLVQGPGLAEGGDARHDQTRVDRVERVPSEAPALEDAGAEVLEDDVALRHQPADDILPLRRVQVEGHELLVPVVDSEPVRAAVLRRAEAPEVVAPARHLGLDHLGPELRHERAAERARDHLSELEHPDSVEGSA